MARSAPASRALYARDYIAQLGRVVAAPKPGAYFSDAAALGAFTKTPSPLKLLLLELRKNTSFTGGAAGAAKTAAMGALQSRMGRAGELAAASGSAAAATSMPAPKSAAISNRCTNMSATARRPRRIDEFVAAMKQAGAKVTSARMAGGGMGSDAVQSALALAMGALATSSGGAPPQMQGFVSSATQRRLEGARSARRKGAMSDAYTQSVLPACQEATKEKYPFSALPRPMRRSSTCSACSAWAEWSRASCSSG